MAKNITESKPLQTFNELLNALASTDPAIRHHAAHQLEEFAESAVGALFTAIARPENKNYTGTLVYVLRSYNCEDHFTALFDLALHGGFEVQNHALYILWRQYFVVTTKQLLAAENALNDLRERENLTTDDLELLRTDLQIILKRVALSIPKNK
jgi:hypothetical protein